MATFPAWLTQLLEIPEVKDILVSGNDCQIDRGQGLETIAAPLPSLEQLTQDLRELAFNLGARLDIASPVADVGRDNLRFHLVLPHSISDVPHLSVRLHPAERISIGQLVEADFVSQQQASFLMRQVEFHKTIVISGPTGSGKTTLLRALIADLDERIIAIEQIPELNLPHPAISLVSRPGDQDAKGEITLADLVTHSLRMRPDRVVVGEVRKSEFAAFLQAVSNGHPGSLTTLHASSIDAVPRRLVTLGLLSGFTRELTVELVLGAIDLVVQLERSGGKRQIQSIAELARDNGDIQMREIS